MAGRARGGVAAGVKHLIVNADDFGETRGINRGVAEAHVDGIVTSASLMVDAPGSGEAARLSADLPTLSVGLHVKITDERARSRIDLRDTAKLRAELRRQMERFGALMGRAPDHLDSHHNVHLLPDATACFSELADAHGIVLRGCSPVRYFPSFYGQWDGQSHLEHIGIESLLGMLEREIGEGFTELGCHPGYVDATLESGYAIERETELRTLCAPPVREKLAELNVELVTSTAARRQLAVAPADDLSQAATRG
jgi:predicted glycoside hydrolase/deacetylase ChbG (UPF0249 family)